VYKQASLHNIFCTLISHSTEYTMQADLLCTQRTLFPVLTPLPVYAA
jgi:hypothetical protein